MADNATLPATGDVIAADDVGGVKYQRVKNSFGADGAATDVQETKPLPVVTLPRGDIFCIDIPSQVLVAAASTVHFDLFNADAALLLRVLSIRQIPDIVTAVTGAAIAWLFQRTTAVGTGGSSVTPWPTDTSQTALDADMTCRSKPTGGATTGTQLRSFSMHSEETNTGTLAIAAAGGLELVPAALTPALGGRGILLRQNQGLKVTQNTNTNAGNLGWAITFAVE